MQTNLFDLYLKLYAQPYIPDDGRKDRPKHVECYFKINKFVKLVHLVGFTPEKCPCMTVYQTVIALNNCIAHRNICYSIKIIIYFHGKWLIQQRDHKIPLSELLWPVQFSPHHRNLFLQITFLGILPLSSVIGIMCRWQKKYERCLW